MKRHIFQKCISGLFAGILCVALSGCDHIFKPVDEPMATDGSDPYYHWQDTTAPTTLPPETQPTEETTKIGYVTGEILNIRSGPGTEFDILGTLHWGNRVELLEERAVDGKLWGLTEAGWISMEYVSTDGKLPSVRGTVTTKTLNIRSGPGTDHSVVGTLSRGDTVSILEQTTVGSSTWGRISEGWISLSYVELQEVVTGSRTAVVTNKYVNLRSGAGFAYDVIGQLSMNDEVIISEELEADGLTWGNIGTGWICMDYVKITGTVNTPEKDDPQEDKPQNPVLDTTAVGTWISMDEASYFTGGAPSPVSWTFHEDGTYTCSTGNYICQADTGWQLSGDAKNSSGTYTFNGSELALSNGTTMNVSITGDSMSVFGDKNHSLMLRNYDVNMLIKTLIRKDRGEWNSSIFGSWTGISQPTYVAGKELTASEWYFGKDGSFTETVMACVYEDGSGFAPGAGSIVYSGVYFYDGIRLTLCYETRTDGSSWVSDPDIRYVVIGGISISGNTLEMTDIGMYAMKDSDINTVAAALN